MGRVIQMNIIIPGVYDLFHEGHKKLIQYGSFINGEDKIIIVINSSELCELNGKKIKESDEVRVQRVEKYLAHKKIEAEVVLISKIDDTIKIALENSPCFWLTGRDWNLKTTSVRNRIKETFWESNNIYLIYKDRVPHISSTKLRGKR